MTHFDREHLDRSDWEIFQNGWVMLYWHREILNGDVEQLAAHGYKVFQFDCDGWFVPINALSDLGKTLAFPDYYGQNLDAFDDCLDGIDLLVDGRVALVFSRFDHFSARHRDAAYALLDICAEIPAD